jgi:hypothetical protein
MPSKFDTKDLMTLEGETFKTPTYFGSQTVFNFKGDHFHKDEFSGLMFTDYFRMPKVDGMKCHFTVKLRIKKQPKKSAQDFQFVDVGWHNPHLTIRTDANASAHANKPGLHRSCDNEASVWSGNDPAIDPGLAHLPTYEDAAFMWKQYLYELQCFLGLVNSVAKDISL